MNFTGYNLRLIQVAVARAISDIQSEIGSCPDVFEYADDLEDLEGDKQVFEKLLERINRSMERENAKLGTGSPME